jgi:hypothetical protein
VHVKTSAPAFGVLALVAALLAGCAAPAGGQMPQHEPSASATPTGSPDPTPSGYVTGDTIAGRVTKGGPGPCYEVVNDDGLVYALYSTAGLHLEKDTYITAKVTDLKVRIYCGPGQHLALLSFTKR